MFMRILTIVIGLCWVAFWLYWAVSAISTKKNTKPEIKQYFAPRLGIIFVAALLAFAFNRLPQSIKDHLFGTNKVVLVLGFVVFLLGLVLAIWARIYLGKNWGMPMSKKHDPELVVTGPYQYIRHPIYTGILLMSFGSAVDVNTYWLLVFIVSAVFFIYSALSEEKLMMDQFPKAYPPYKARTKMLIPFIL
jgi:protein-S-isoprenylcysteine O-methyltransferase Ste14